MGSKSDGGGHSGKSPAVEFAGPRRIHGSGNPDASGRLLSRKGWANIRPGRGTIQDQTAVASGAGAAGFAGNVLVGGLIGMGVDALRRAGSQTQSGDRHPAAGGATATAATGRAATAQTVAAAKLSEPGGHATSPPL
jgi:hypothetical protein